MHLVNEHYIKLDSKFDIFAEIVKANDSNDERKLEFFQKLLNIIFDNKNKNCDDGIYISIDNLCVPSIFDLSKLQVTRETICNASLIALYNGDLTVARNLSFFFKKSSCTKGDLGYLSTYVLENGMSIDEYFQDPMKEYIYNENKESIELGYIFKTNKTKYKERKKSI